MGAEATAERDEETVRGDELAAQLEQMTTARDTLRCKILSFAAESLCTLRTTYARQFLPYYSCIWPCSDG